MSIMTQYVVLTGIFVRTTCKLVYELRRKLLSWQRLSSSKHSFMKAILLPIGGNQIK
jgi:hypothetical protein